MDADTLLSPLAHFDPSALLDRLEVPLVVLDAGCCLTWANAAAARLLRTDLGALRGRPFDHAFADSGLRASLKAALEGREGGERGMRLTVREPGCPRRELALRATRFVDDLTGPHLLLQLSRVRRRRRTPVLGLVPGYDSHPVSAVAVAAAAGAGVVATLECA